MKKRKMTGEEGDPDPDLYKEELTWKLTIFQREIDQLFQKKANKTRWINILLKSTNREQDSLRWIKTLGKTEEWQLKQGCNWISETDHWARKDLWRQ